MAAMRRRLWRLLRSRRSQAEQGSIMILAFMVLMALTALVATHLYTVSAVTKSAGFAEVDDQVFWIAEAGIQRAHWNLVTPTGQGGEGLNWTTAGTTESLGAGTYTMVVTRDGNTRFVTSTGSITTGLDTYTREVYEEFIPGKGGPTVPPLVPNDTWIEQ
jgi:Tfp pilus assembly protein PilX